jgi:uncharacterized membrane protein YqjE
VIETSSGLMGSIRRLLSTLTLVATTRLELLANEWQEERLRLTQMLFFALSALFFFGMGILLLTVFIVLLFWEDRLIACGVLSAIFFATGILLAMRCSGKAQQQSGLFSASLAELVNDREQLRHE